MKRLVVPCAIALGLAAIGVGEASALGGANPDEQPCRAQTPAFGSPQPQAAPETAFNDYAASTPDGWTGADSTYSVELPGGRTLWLFSDTYMGPLDADGTRPVEAPMINNTFVVQDGDRLDTVHGGDADNPEAIMPPSKDGAWFWSGDGMIAGANGEPELQVVYREYEKAGEAGWDFSVSRNVAATFSLDDLSTPVAVEELPSQSKTAWGAAIVPTSQSNDGYTYVYGVADDTRDKQMRV
ncbi:MAG: hypothetical protein ACRDXX_01395, partial [Stackebrandtia sp.]